MALNESLIAELDHEAAGTRRVLERLPADALDWRPHEKSFSMGDLGAHLGNLLYWGTTTVGRSSFDAAPDGEPLQFDTPDTVDGILDLFDRNLAEFREGLAATSDAEMAEHWTLLAGGEEIFSRPRAEVLRGFVFNHLIHHRAQLTVYLRMHDVPVPALYGPSADEPM